MSRARIAARLAAEAATEVDNRIAEGELTPGERQQFIEDWVHEGLQEAEYDAACEREAFGTYGPEDTPCLQSADLWGTGEGAHHGIIG